MKEIFHSTLCILLKMHIVEYLDHLEENNYVNFE